MHTSQLPVRTHREFTDEATFHDLMAERLRQSPWLLLSAVMHGAVLLLLWVLLPPERPKAPRATVTLAREPDRPPIVEPPRPEPPKTQAEIDPEVQPVHDTPVHEAESDVPSDIAADERAPTSAFEASQWNVAVGLGPGAAGPYGERGGGGGRGNRRAPSPVVVRGLQWLASHQDEDGRWDADGFARHDDPRFSPCDGLGNAAHDVGVTALALLAFLGEGNTLRGGRYRDVVRRGVLWLRSQQQPDGLIGGRAAHDYIYDHAIATYALCEAYGLSDYKLLASTAQRALEYLEQHRNPYGVWRYQPREQTNDLSVTGWAVMANESGKFFGLTVNDQAETHAAVFLDQVSDASGLHGYTRAGQRSSRKPGEHAARYPADKTHALTAVGLFCRFFLGQDPAEQPVMDAAAQLLTTMPPRWNEADGSIDHYYWYYATYALFQYGGQPWRQWRRALERSVGEHQHADSGERNLFGSWDPVGAWGDDGGRVYSTAILTLTMQANYRYTRLLR